MTMAAVYQNERPVHVSRLGLTFQFRNSFPCYTSFGNRSLPGPGGRSYPPSRLTVDADAGAALPS